MKKDIKFYCFFLPQYHECPFNNEWWGRGFTEWDNVRNAKPLFKGHLQPRIPSHGYFDLTEEGAIELQFDEAKHHGIDGFVFYHYWYEGKRPLGKPLDIIFKNSDININYSLCWANHSWTRSWKNRSGALDVLIEQTYEDAYEDRCIHFRFLHDVFVDSRYICIDKLPLFQIYNPQDIPNLSRFIDELRKFCLKVSNTRIHISALVTAWLPSWDIINSFDSITLHQPALALFSPADIFSELKINMLDHSFFTAAVRALPLPVKKILYPIQDAIFNKASFYDYKSTWEKSLLQTANASHASFRVLPSAFVDFDNTPRYKARAKIIRGFTPELFGYYLRKLCDIMTSELCENILFINAWNEWGEGMYLQSDVDYGNSRLVQIQKIKETLSGDYRM